MLLNVKVAHEHGMRSFNTKENITAMIKVRIPVFYRYQVRALPVRNKLALGNAMDKEGAFNGSICELCLDPPK